MWKIILLKWDNLVLSIGSIIYGLVICFQPSILQNYRVYELIREMFDNRVIGVAFMALGSLKLVGIALDHPTIKKVAMRGLLFVWLLFLIAFLITPPANTVWILAFVMFSIGIGIVTREE